MNLIIPMQLQITGAVPSKFNMNDYVEDCVNVSALMPLDAEQGGYGYSAEVFKYKTSEDIEEFKDIDFTKPVQADCRVEIVKRGKKTVMVLREIQFKASAPSTTPKQPAKA